MLALLAAKCAVPILPLQRLLSKISMNFRLPIIVTATVLCSPLIAQDAPLPVAEAAARMTLPKGFTATLFAGEPDVVQPIAFTFDDRGRLWVVECLSYPDWQ